MKLGDKEFKANVSIGTMMEFETMTGKSFGSLVIEIIEKIKEHSKDGFEMMKVINEYYTDVAKMAYVMARPDEPYEDWVKDITITGKEFMEILTMAQTIFRG